MITGYFPDPPSGLYLSVARSVPSRIGTWIVSQTTPGNAGLVTGAAPATPATTRQIDSNVFTEARTRIGSPSAHESSSAGRVAPPSSDATIGRGDGRPLAG